MRLVLGKCSSAVQGHGLLGRKASIFPVVSSFLDFELFLRSSGSRAQGSKFQRFQICALAGSVSGLSRLSRSGSANLSSEFSSSKTAKADFPEEAALELRRLDYMGKIQHRPCQGHRMSKTTSRSLQPCLGPRRFTSGKPRNTHRLPRL